MKFCIFLILSILPLNTILASSDKDSDEVAGETTDLASLITAQEIIDSFLDVTQRKYLPRVSEHFQKKIEDFSKSQFNRRNRRVNREAYSLSLLYAWNAVWNTAFRAANTVINDDSKKFSSWSTASKILDNATKNIAKDASWSAAWAFACSAANYPNWKPMRELALSAHKDYLPDGDLCYKPILVVWPLIERQMMIYLDSNFDSIMDEVYHASYLSLVQDGRIGNCNGFISNYGKWERKNITEKLKDNPSAIEILMPILTELRRLDEEMPKNTCVTM